MDPADRFSSQSETNQCHLAIPICDGQGQIPMACSHVAMSPQEVPLSA
jgi:hypothetical protein